jgi:hypothetical protein
VVRLDRGGDWTNSGCGTAEYLAAFLGGDMPVPPTMTLWEPEALGSSPESSASQLAQAASGCQLGKLSIRIPTDLHPGQSLIAELISRESP